eukprot:gene8745-33605_t
MDKTRKIQYLLKLLNEASAGRNIRQAVPEVMQASFSSSEDPVIKKLTYDVCKAAYLSEAESEVLITQLKVDLKSSLPSLVKISLEFIPSLPPAQLSTLLEIGELSEYVESLMSHDNATIRAAAASCMAEVLLLDDLLAAAATSVEMANTYTQLWESVADSILDEDSHVTTVGVSAVAKLLHAASVAKDQLPTGFLLQRVGSVTGGRIIAALGPVLGACQAVHSPGGQAQMAMMLRLVGESALKPPGRGTAPAPLSSAELGTPGLVAILESLCSYWASLSTHVDAATRLEACKAVLSIVAHLHQHEAVGEGSLTTVGDLALPTSTWAAEAILTLFDLEDQQLMEAGLTDVVSLISRHMGMVPVELQSVVLRRLWTVIEKVQDVPCRMEAYALTWHAVLQSEVRGRHMAEHPTFMLTPQSEAPGLKLSSALNDTYISNVLRGSLYQPMAAHDSEASKSADSTLSQMSTRPSLPPSSSMRSSNNRVGTTSQNGAKEGNPPPAAKAQEAAPHPQAPAPAAAAALASAQAQESGKKKGKGLFMGMVKMIRHGQAVTGSTGQPASSAASVSTQPPAADEAVLSVPDTTHQFVASKQQHNHARDMPAGAAATSNAAVVSRIEGPKTHTRPPPQLSSLRHEIVISLMEVVLHQPTASAALHLCRLAQSADEHRVVLSTAEAGQMTESEEDVVHWVGIAKSVLQATLSCVSWEPLITPTISTEVSAVAQLLQGACHTARAVRSLLHKQLQEQQEADNAFGGVVANPDGNPFGAEATSEHGSPKMLSVMKEWSTLSQAVRPRLTWILAHYLSLPCFNDSSWDAMLRCVGDLLVRGGASQGGNAAALRLESLMKSAADGKLFKSSRSIEAPVVALSSMQALAIVLHNHIAAAAKALKTATSAMSATTQSAESGDDAEAAPSAPKDLVHLQEEAKQLTTISAYQPPKEESKGDEAEVAEDAYDDNSSRAAEETEEEVAPHKFGQFQDQVVDDDSSSSSSGYKPGAGDMPVFMPPSMYPPNRNAPPLRADAPNFHQGCTVEQTQLSRNAPPPLPDAPNFQQGFTVEQTQLPPSAENPTGAEVSSLNKTSATQFGANGTYSQAPKILESVAVKSLWGYPFAGPRSNVLHHSKRSRRHRALINHVDSAMLQLAEAGDAPGVARGLAGGPVLSSNSMFKLDSRTFWDLLPGHPEHWEDLTGPGDPVLLCGSYYLNEEDDRFSSMDIQCKLLMCPAVVSGDATLVELHCQPLHISMASLLCSPPDSHGDSAPKFFNPSDSHGDSAPKFFK